MGRVVRDVTENCLEDPDEPALPGWRAALVPVAIPIVVRPALLVVALGAGADHTAWVALGAMATGVAALAGLVAANPTQGSAARILRWGARLLAAALIAGGIVLSIDGIMDV